MLAIRCMIANAHVKWHLFSAFGSLASIYRIMQNLPARPPLATGLLLAVGILALTGVVLFNALLVCLLVHWTKEKHMKYLTLLRTEHERATERTVPSPREQCVPCEHAGYRLAVCDFKRELAKK